MSNISDLNKPSDDEGKQNENPTPPSTSPNESKSEVSSDSATTTLNSGTSSKSTDAVTSTEGKQNPNPTTSSPGTTTTSPTGVASVSSSSGTTTTTPSQQATSNDFLDYMLGKFEPIEEQKTNFKMLIYSDPGVGKTDFLGQIPNHLIVDSEEGTESIMYSERRASNVQRLPFKTFEGLEKVIEEFHKNPEQLKHIKNLSIDTLSNLHKRGLAEVMKTAYDKAPSLNNKYLAETEHHTENNERIRQLVQAMVSLERNVFLTVHKRTIEPKNQTARTFPDFSEKLANTIAGMMDVVAFMYIANIDGENKRVLKFQPTDAIVAKARGRGKDLPDNMIDPTWDKINEYLKLDM